MIESFYFAVMIALDSLNTRVIYLDRVPFLLQKIQTSNAVQTFYGRARQSLIFLPTTKIILALYPGGTSSLEQTTVPQLHTPREPYIYN